MCLSLLHNVPKLGSAKYGTWSPQNAESGVHKVQARWLCNVQKAFPQRVELRKIALFRKVQNVVSAECGATLVYELSRVDSAKCRRWLCNVRN